MPRSFPLTESQLTAVVLGYTNTEFVQDILCPRAKVTTEAYTYYQYPEGRYFDNPDGTIGNRGEVDRITSNFSKKTGYISDYALEEAVTITDLESAPKGVDLRKNELELLSYYLMLGREKRVAELYSTTANYKYSATAGSDKWSSPSTDIYGQVDDIMNKPLVRPNTLVLSQTSYRHMRKNAEIRKAIGGNDQGVATNQQLADLFEVDKIVVVKSKVNVAKKGKPADIQDIWGNTLAAVYLAPVPSVKNPNTFCLTASLEKGQKNYEEEKTGAKGAYIVKAFDRCRELVIGKGCGAILSDII